LIRTGLSFFDWLCINDKFIFMFNEECGKANLAFIMNTCNYILCQFRKPKESKESEMAIHMNLDNNPMFGMGIPVMEELAFNEKSNKAVQDKRKYDIFPFTDIGSIL